MAEDKAKIRVKQNYETMTKHKGSKIIWVGYKKI